MCGIVGLFLKGPKLAPALGGMLTDMLVTMTNRGPDSAGIAVYTACTEGTSKLTIQSADPAQDFNELDQALSDALATPVTLAVKDTHAVISVASERLADVRTALANVRPQVRTMSAGDVMEIYKEVGLPDEVAKRFNIASMAGTHGIGHTRMATESAVTTMGAHPFSTGPDQCLVHNGSLSNHNSLRRKLLTLGMQIQTENDSEIAAAYLSWKMQQGSSLGEAMQSSLDDLDGFFTFVVGTKDGFGVLRDPIACKPAVMAETDEFVAFGSEYRALVNLPDINSARVWEPEPATVYFWSH